MTLTGTRTMHPHLPRLREFRFDPRLVVAGLVLLASGTVFGFAMAGQAQQAADDVAAPVAALCQQGGPTGAKLADTGACAASANTGVGPFQSEVVAGPAGGRGAAGAPGADSLIPGPGGAPSLPGADSTVPGSPGKDGEPGADSTVPGADGQDGADGVSPACLSEPSQCRGQDGAPGAPGQDGAPGRDGVDGAQGPPGPTCPEGTSLQPVMFADGQSGRGCVQPSSDPEEGTP